MTEKARAPKGADNQKRRFFGRFEAVFDAVYLCAALAMGLYSLSRPGRAYTLTGGMALVLVTGDAFHLVPRIIGALTGGGRLLKRALGFGKFAASMGMTIFYVLLWHLGAHLFGPVAAGWTAAVYALAALRIALLLPARNGWFAEVQPLDWAVYRNIPFLLLGAAVALLFGLRAGGSHLWWIWLAVALSFAFYMPVVLWAGRYRMLGMLMLPKTCAYLWILLLCAVR